MMFRGERIKCSPSTKQELFPSCVFVCFVLTVLFLLGCAGAPKHPTWKSSTGAKEFEKLMWQSIQKKDWKEVEFHLAPTFTGISPAGNVLDGAGWLEYWKTAKIDSLELNELQSQPAGADMVVTCVVRLSGNQPAAPPVQGNYRVISVWQQLKDGWTLTAASLTPLVRP